MNMKRKNSANIIVRESITQALFRLMRRKDFDEISIKELTTLAGVGRASFYRNYKSKDEVILDYMAEVGIEWWSTFEFSSHNENWLKIFQLMDLLQEPISLLYKSGMSSLFYEYVYMCVHSTKPKDSKDAYERAITSGAVFGVLDEWIQRGKEESPQEIVKILVKSINYDANIK